MRRTLTALFVAIACAFAGQADARALPAPPVKITISDYTPHPGQTMIVWFKSAAMAHHKIKVYIDTPTNPLGTVTASTTGYGKLTFTLSKYAKVGSRHSLGLADLATGVGAYKTFNVVAR